MAQQNPPIGFALPSTPNQFYPPQSQQPTYPPPAYNHQPFPAPIQNQPGVGNYAAGGNWFSGTDFQNHLINASSFVVKQKTEILEAVLGWEQNNHYAVKDQNGQKVFYVSEDSSCFGRQFCGERRPFHLTVKDTRGCPVLAFDRNFIDCSCCCGLFCPDEVEVRAASSSQKLGSVKEEFSVFLPRFLIKDPSGRTVLKIVGPFVPCHVFKCGKPVAFDIQTPDGSVVGQIKKVWGGFVREFLTDADSFSISFPASLDASIKAVCLGALFMIDFQYFEDEATWFQN